jgi:hypothetical protein
MHDQDGSVGRNGVEVGAGRVALFLKLRVIVAETDDDAVAFDDLAVLADPVMQNALQRRDVVAFAVGRRQEVRRKRLEPDHDDMAVRIDEAGQQRLALEIDGRDRPLRLFLDLGAGADGDDFSAPHEHRLGGRLHVIDCDDRTSDIKRVDALVRRLRRAANEGARRRPRHSGPGDPVF